MTVIATEEQDVREVEGILGEVNSTVDELTAALCDLTPRDLLNPGMCSYLCGLGRSLQESLAVLEDRSPRRGEPRA